MLREKRNAFIKTFTDSRSNKTKCLWHSILIMSWVSIYAFKYAYNLTIIFHILLVSYLWYEIIPLNIGWLSSKWLRDLSLEARYSRTGSLAMLTKTEVCSSDMAYGWRLVKEFCLLIIIQQLNEKNTAPISPFYELCFIFCSEYQYEQTLVVLVLVWRNLNSISSRYQMTFNWSAFTCLQ